MPFHWVVCVALLLLSAVAQNNDIISFPVFHDGLWVNASIGASELHAVLAQKLPLSGVASKSLVATALKAAEDLKSAMDTFYLMFGGILVFFMQCGFALLEAGSVRSKNTKNIILKNVLDACIAAVLFYLVGYGFAFGKGNAFIGATAFALTDAEFWNFYPGENSPPTYFGSAYATWFFQFTFCATAATIVSGACAERMTFFGYLVSSSMLTAFIYPVIVHWGWSSSGWASAFLDIETYGPKLLGVGVLDFAGCAVVHLVGGVAALVAVAAMGPRVGRFDEETKEPIDIPQQSAAWQMLGTFILWFGWFGFNCASTLALSGGLANVAAKVAVTTVLSPCAAVVSSLCVGFYRHKRIDLGHGINGCLVGLVSITSACSTCEPWAALVIGAMGGLLFSAFSAFMVRMKQDDVVDAVAVHGVGGAWGCIAAALFATEVNYNAAYFDNLTPKSFGLFYGGGGNQFGANVIFVFAVIAWVSLTTIPLYFGLKKAGLLRVPREMEELGMDEAKHGGRDAAHLIRLNSSRKTRVFAFVPGDETAPN